MAENWTKTQLNNWISQKQCCLGEYLKKVVKLGEIGSKDFKCCMNKFILVNIYLEMLAELKSDLVPSNGSVAIGTDSNQSYPLRNVTIYLNGVVLIPTDTASPGVGGVTILQHYINLINNSGTDFTAYMKLEDTTGYISFVIQAPDETYNGDTITIVVENIVAGTTSTTTLKLSGGVADDSACLTRSEQCELINFIKNICETC